MNQSEQQSRDERDGVPTLLPDAERRGPAGPGVQIGNFQLQVLLGRGGMGEVWKAWDIKAERLVVLKLVPPELQRAAEMARVKATFQRVHALQHQHICPLYLLDEDPRFGWYLVMKFIDGQTLSSYRVTYAARHGGFPVEQVVRVLRPVAEALDYAHRHKVIHRDVKPQNILVEGDAEDVQVVDFGLAAEIRTTVSRHTQVQMDTSGTRPYMAPEQWKGQIQDARTDQYALAVVAYELLAGHLPFESADFDILRACVLNDPPEAIEGQAEGVNRALLVGLGKRRDERFGSCVEFVQAIHGKGFASPVPMPSPLQTAVRPSAKVPSSPPTSAAVKRRQPVVRQVPQQDPQHPCPACGAMVQLGPQTAGKEVSCSNCQTVLKVSADRQQLAAQPPAAPALKPLNVITNSIGMKLVLIPEGEFLMGSPDSDLSAGDDEKPQHRVQIANPFYLGVTEVTQQQYETVMGQNPSQFTGDLERPVERVSWEDAAAFCRKLSEQEEQTYRLPTEAEWEYGCRAGSKTKWCSGDAEATLKEYAWYGESSGSTVHPVAQKKPNAWGLYDMHGNVWEWCSDWFGAYGQGSVTDPQGPSAGGSRRVCRGGSWRYDASCCRASCRLWNNPGNRNGYLGFRLARQFPSSSK